MSDEDLWKTIEADASADADAFEDLTTEGATELASMIRNLGAIQTKLVAAEEEAKSLKREQNRYLHDLIPAKMQETGLEEAKVGGNKQDQLPQHLRRQSLHRLTLPPRTLLPCPPRPSPRGP